MFQGSGFLTSMGRWGLCQRTFAPASLAASRCQPFLSSDTSHPDHFPSVALLLYFPTKMCREYWLRLLEFTDWGCMPDYLTLDI